jgi:proteasome alpha subunit
MTMPYYVAPEQVMKDRADYARKGIARGRAMVAVRYADGVALVAENPSNTLRKISEIYDRIAFAGVGKYNEFDQLRVAGVRAADLKGYQYSRDDVDARGLANQYAQILGQVFTHEMKPMEVEILVAEVGYGSDDYQLFHILYDGTVMDERRYSVLGGDAEAIAGRLNESYTDELVQADAVKVATAALGRNGAHARRRRPRGRGVGPIQRPPVFQAPDRRRGRPDPRCLALRVDWRHVAQGRSQQRCRRGVRGVEGWPRSRVDGHHHLGQHRLRVPRRRSVDHAPHV